MFNEISTLPTSVDGNTLTKFSSIRRLQKGGHKNPCNLPTCDGYPLYKKKLVNRALHEIFHRLFYAKSVPHAANEYSRLLEFLKLLSQRMEGTFSRDYHHLSILLIANYAFRKTCTSYRSVYWHQKELFLPNEVPCKETCKKRDLTITNFDRFGDELPGIHEMKATWLTTLQVIEFNHVLKARFNKLERC
ncbi:hypothetical protein QAD02_014217 [Eretmocerus hayati]|uniref:Uncharacterized protein n=1 Tax=Eretmocerus hayati TaxID=131215 RepID=A0ACC2P4C0_9HYME|nr:hypothetical protein QAD02_014217 [Eretmocerus hayati]